MQDNLLDKLKELEIKYPDKTEYIKGLVDGLILSKQMEDEKNGKNEGMER